MTDAAKNIETNPSTRLIGWLVSYELDAMGKAYEIRSGRTIIGSRRLDASSIALSHPSISAPHMAIHASETHKLLVQDIFSEHGSFIKRGGSSKEEPFSGPVEISHGDWIRIGEKTKFQVCLIDGPNS